MSTMLENQVSELKHHIAVQEAELAYLRAAFEDFVERVDSALLIDEELADAWVDLCNGVVKARKVLDGGRVENENGNG